MKKKIPDMLDNPHVGWLSGRLTHKALVALIGLAVLSGLLICQSYLSYLGKYADNTYNKIISQSDTNAQTAAGYLRSADDFSALKEYVSSHGVSCEVRDSAGKLVFDYRAFSEEKGFLVSSSAKVAPKDGGEFTVRVWSIPLRAGDVEQSLRRSALTGLIVMIACIFVVVAVLLYLLVLAPIVSLRRTVRRYYEHGEEPQPSARQDEIGRLQNTFVDMAGALAEEKQAERRLVASISHDLKTPLTSVMGYSERLLSVELPAEKQHRYLRNIYDKALVIKGIVDEFDEYLEVGIHENVQMSDITMYEFCKSVRNEYRDELADAGVKFTVECLCPEDVLRCNYDQMRRVLGNLIGNSIQHANAEHLELNLVCASKDDRIILSFSDNGQGVPPELLGRIFEPFFTTDSGRKVSGLGLSICESVIRAHGGSLSAENMPTGGLLVKAVLPVARREDKASS